MDDLKLRFTKHISIFDMLEISVQHLLLKALTMLIFWLTNPLILVSQENLGSMGLIDSVRSVREIRYSAFDEAGELQRRVISSDRFVTFDFKGNIREVLIYNKGRLYSTLEYNYDEQGRCTSFKETDARDRVYLLVTYEYGEDGWLDREIIDRSFQKMYDDQRQEINVEYHEYYKNLYTQIEYEYNILNLVTKKRFLKPDSTIDYVHEFTYSIKRYVDRKNYVNEHGDVSWYEKMKNNLSGWPVEVKRFEKSRVVSIKAIEYETDTRGNWISRKETKEIPENIYGDPAQKSTEVTIREIEYF